MPSVSKKQHNLMALVANDPKAAKRLGISQKVGREFMKADKGRKFGSGGSMKESKAMMRKEVAFMKKKGAPKSMIKHEEAEYGMKKGVKKMRSGGPSRGRGAAPAPGSLAGLARNPNQNVAINAWAKGQKTMFPIYQRTGFPSGRSGTESNYQYDPAYDPAFEQKYREFEQSERDAAYAKGGKTESRAMMKKEVAFMKKKGAPKSMIRHEEAEYGMKKGVKKMREGGMTGSFRRQADGVAHKGKTRGKMVKMAYGGKC